MYTIIGGDFNVVMNPTIDRSEPNWYNVNAHKTINDDMLANDLVDIWRVQHQKEKRFTWVKTRPRIVWSRIDYFLVSNNMLNLQIKADIVPCILSDHSAIVLEFELGLGRRGPGIWKLNDTYLDDELFVKKLKALITGIKRVYNYLSKSELWELLKVEIAKFCKTWSKDKCNEMEIEKFNLYKILAAIQDKLINHQDNVNPTTVKSMERIQCELDSFATLEAKRAAFRCKQNWAKYGEVPSSYFFNLEKRNYTRKTMYAIKRDDGSITKEYQEILDLQYRFFEKLYTSDNNIEFAMQNNSGVRIDADGKISLESEFSNKELFDSMMTLKAGKTPGVDGLSLKLYKVCWKELVDPLADML